MNGSGTTQQSSRMVHWLFWIQLISMGAMEMSGPFWPVYLKGLAASDAEFGFAGVAVYVLPMLGVVLTSAFWGRVGDRTGHRLMMVRALLGLALTQLGLAFAADVWVILALRFAQGACAGYLAPAQSYGVAVVPAERRGRLFAYLQVSTNVGSFLGAVAGGVIFDHAAFFWINLVASGLCAACAVAVVCVLPDQRLVLHRPEAGTAASTVAFSAPPRWWRTPMVPGLLVALGLLLLSRTLTQMPFSLYVGSVFQVGNGVVGLCYGMLSLGVAVSASAWAWWFERRALPRALRGVACVAVACMALTLAAGLTRDIRVFVVLHFVWGMLLGATTPVLTNLVSQAVDGRRQGYFLGVAQSTSQFSTMAGIVLGGWFSQGAGLGLVYFLVASAYAVAALFIVAMMVRIRLKAAMSAASVALVLVLLPPGGPAEAAPAAQTAIEVTDLLGRRVKVRIPVQRVLLGEGRQLYLVAALDTDDPLRRIVGWRKDLIQSDPDTYLAYLRKFPRIADIPTFGGFEQGTFDIEQAVALQPDVIVMNIESRRATDDARYVEKLAALGIPVVYVDFRYHPIENIEPTMRLFGRLFGKEDRAEAFIAFRREQMRRVTDVIARQQPKRPKVFIERIGGYSDDCCLSFGDENFGKFVEMAGGENIAKGIIRGTFGQLNPEQVVAADPDQVVITSANWEAFVPNGRWIGLGPGADIGQAVDKLRGFTRRPAYTGIAANRTGSFHGIWHQFYNSPYDFVAVQQLAKWFHPRLFQDLDPDATFRELHQRFLPLDYRPGYFVSLPQTQADRLEAAQ